MTDLIHGFWYQKPREMIPGRCHVKQVGRFTVRTWFDLDNRLICTGWFKDWT